MKSSPLEKAAMERWRNGDPMGFVELSAEDILYVDVGQTKPIQGLEPFGLTCRNWRA